MTDIAAQVHALRSWLLDGALPLWWDLGADRDRGGFHEAIDRIRIVRAPSPGRPSRIAKPAGSAGMARGAKRQITRFHISASTSSAPMGPSTRS